MRRRAEGLEDETLAPYAARSAGQKRRHGLPREGRAFDYRTAFQRDRDRIVYSRAFRRLRQKAQSGILPEYEDHRRNRMTHTLEVAQLARTIGRALELHEDLVEAIALGHDLGTPPFGPAGERALADAMCGDLDGRGGPGLGDLGGFDRRRQNLRIVDRLEKRYDAHDGLNLTDTVRDGLLRAGIGVRGDAPDAEDVAGIDPEAAPSFETQVVTLADRIATVLHDLDDALQAGVVEVARAERLRAIAELRRKLGARYPSRAGRFMKANAIHRGLTHLLVTGAIVHSGERLRAWAEGHAVSDAATFARLPSDAFAGDEVRLPPAGERILREIETFVDGRVRRGFAADRDEVRARRILLGLLAAYHRDPSLLEDWVLLRYKQATGRRYLRDVARDRLRSETDAYRADPRFVRGVCDYLAGMTDGYAITEHRRLTAMGAVPIPSVEQLRREDDR